MPRFIVEKTSIRLDSWEVEAPDEKSAIDITVDEQPATDDTYLVEEFEATEDATWKVHDA